MESFVRNFLKIFYSTQRMNSSSLKCNPAIDETISRCSCDNRSEGAKIRSRDPDHSTVTWSRILQLYI